MSIGPTPWAGLPVFGDKCGLAGALPLPACAEGLLDLVPVGVMTDERVLGSRNIRVDDCDHQGPESRNPRRVNVGNEPAAGRKMSTKVRTVWG